MYPNMYTLVDKFVLRAEFRRSDSFLDSLPSWPHREIGERQVWVAAGRDEGALAYCLEYGGAASSTS